MRKLNKQAIAERLTAYDSEGCIAIEEAVKMIVRDNGDEDKIKKALWSEELIDFDRHPLDNWITENGKCKKGIIKNYVNPFIADVKKVEKYLTR